MMPDITIDSINNDLSYYTDIVCLKTPYKNNTRSVSYSSNGSDDTNLLSVISEDHVASQDVVRLGLQLGLGPEAPEEVVIGPEVDAEACPEADVGSDYENETLTSSPPPSPRQLEQLEQLESIPQPHQKTHRRRKSVRFDKITIREYDLTVGDNPACTAGAPVSLSWTYNPRTVETFPVDVYESYRDGQRCGPEDLKLNERVRHRLLLEWDVPVSKIRRAERKCRLVQDQRRYTIECLVQEEQEREEREQEGRRNGGGPKLLRNIKETFSRIFSP